MNNAMVDKKGKMPFYSADWEEVTTAQLTADGYNPGKSFFLRVESAGRINALGDNMNLGENILTPFFEGDNPLLCKRIIGDAAATATGVFALFLD